MSTIFVGTTSSNPNGHPRPKVEGEIPFMEWGRIRPGLGPQAPVRNVVRTARLEPISVSGAGLASAGNRHRLYSKR